MWKKSEDEASTGTQANYTPSNSVDQLKHRAIIGTSILVKGDLSGDEDLVVQGQVEGKIELRKNNVTVGQRGRVKADIYAKVISVEGEVEGNLFGDEKIIIRKSGRVKGNLVAPRVSLEEGSNFKGSIDMDSGQASKPEQPKIKISRERDRPEGEKKMEKVPLGFGSEKATDGATKGQ